MKAIYVNTQALHSCNNKNNANCYIMIICFFLLPKYIFVYIKCLLEYYEVRDPFVCSLFFLILLNIQQGAVHIYIAHDLRSKIYQ